MPCTAGGVVAGEALKRAAKRAGLPAETAKAFALHDFRRVTASLLAEGGADVTTAAAMMGYKRASVLLDIYARAQRAPKRAAVQRLQAVLYPVESSPQLLPSANSSSECSSKGVSHPLRVAFPIWWARRDSNPGPLGCEPNALTS